MPRKKGASNAAGTSSAKKSDKPPVWINIALTDDDYASLATMDSETDKIAAEFLSLTLQDYSVGIKRTPSGDGWMAYIIGAASDDPSQSVGLSGYADEPVDACISLLYKFFHKLEGQLLVPEKRESRRFR